MEQHDKALKVDKISPTGDPFSLLLTTVRLALGLTGKRILNNVKSY